MTTPIEILPEAIIVQGVSPSHSLTPAKVDPAKTPKTNGSGSGGGGGASTEPVSRVQVFRNVASRIPMNDYGLPRLVYRPDLIPEDLFFKDEVTKAHILDTASIEIHYREGFPTFEDGHAFWSQMPFEPDDAYRAFQYYLDLGNTQGVRRIECLYEQNMGSFVGNPMELAEFFTYYTWGPRCKAYDLFSAAAHQKLREKRVLATTNTHFLEAEKLLSIVKGYFEKEIEVLDEETGEPTGEMELAFLMELTPKVALDMLSRLVQIQRISLGLPAHGLTSGAEGVAPPNAEIEVVLKTIARAGLDPEANASALGSHDIEMILGDPETAALAQQLIIKIGAPGG